MSAMSLQEKALLSRRQLLRAGGVAFSSLPLAGLLRAEAAAGQEAAAGEGLLAPPSASAPRGAAPVVLPWPKPRERCAL